MSMDPSRKHSPSPLTEESSSFLTLARFLFSNSSHPLFSILATSTLLALLYLPRPLLPFLFSPLTVSALLLLLALLLRLAPPPPPPPSPPEQPTVPGELTPPPPKPENYVQVQEIDGRHQKANFCDAYVDWVRRSGPLEVIYEEYEEEEDEEHSGRRSPEYSRSPQDFSFGAAAAALGSLSFGSYSGSDTESSGSVGGSPASAEGWGSPEKSCFRWADEEEVEEKDEEEDDELIEIALEEDNLIEIDISGGR